MRNYRESRSVGFIAFVLLAFTMTILTSACGKKADDTVAANSGNQVGGLKKSMNVANEAAAIRTLQTIFEARLNTCSVMEKSTERSISWYRIDISTSVFQVGLLVEGYAFTIKLTPKSGSESASFTINADPKTADGTSTGGARHLYMDSSSNVVRGNANRSATVSDLPLQ